MKDFLKRLIAFNRRDCIGLACWFLVSVVIGIIALPIMVWREVHQYNHYRLKRFELEDVVRYGMVILLGSVVNYLIIDCAL